VNNSASPIIPRTASGQIPITTGAGRDLDLTDGADGADVGVGAVVVAGDLAGWATRNSLPMTSSLGQGLAIPRMISLRGRIPRRCGVGAVEAVTLPRATRPDQAMAVRVFAVAVVAVVRADMPRKMRLSSPRPMVVHDSVAVVPGKTVRPPRPQ
jgi:hypothetical protein